MSAQLPVPLTPSVHFSVLTNTSSRRSACDHCHAQKLRCTKASDSGPDICTRCQRLDRPCCWSPPLRSGRRPGKNKPKTKTAITDGVANRGRVATVQSHPSLSRSMQPETMATPPLRNSTFQDAPSGTLTQDWSLFEPFDLFSPQALDGNGLGLPLWTPGDPQNAPQPMEEAEQPHLQTQLEASAANSQASKPIELAQTLSYLNMDLLRLRESLHEEPWPSMFESPTTVVNRLDACNNHPERITSEYPLAEIFKKTQSFIEIAKRSTPHEPERAPFFGTLASSPSRGPGGCPSSSESDSDATQRRECRRRRNSMSSSDSSVSLGRQSRSHPCLPPTAAAGQCMRESAPTAAAHLPNALALASCYHLILCIYTTLFTHILHFDQGLTLAAASGGEDDRAKIHPTFPPLQWGSFQPTDYGPLQMLMVVQIASFLLNDVDRTLGVDEWERNISRPRSRSIDGSLRSRPPKRKRDNGCGNRTAGPYDTEPRALERHPLSWTLIEMVVKEDAADAQGSRAGKVVTLRSLMKKVEKQLKAGVVAR